MPQHDAYLQILRQSFDRAGADLELYFGTTSGEIFGSRDAASGGSVASRPPAIASLRVGR